MRRMKSQRISTNTFTRKLARKANSRTRPYRPNANHKRTYRATACMSISRISQKKGTKSKKGDSLPRSQILGETDMQFSPLCFLCLFVAPFSSPVGAVTTQADAIEPARQHDERRHPDQLDQEADEKIRPL